MILNKCINFTNLVCLLVSPISFLERCLLLISNRSTVWKTIALKLKVVLVVKALLRNIVADPDARNVIESSYQVKNILVLE